MSQPDFSPITSEGQLTQALSYVARQVIKLGERVIGQTMPLDTLTIFAQDQAEYDVVARLIRKHGLESRFTHGATLYIDSNVTILGQQIAFLGVRQPDATRPQVGYGDFPVEDFTAMQRATQDNPFVIPIESGQGQPLLELRHPDFDVLGYMFDRRDHEVTSSS